MWLYPGGCMKQNSFQIIGRGYTCLPAVFLKIRIRPDVREEGLQPINTATAACYGPGAWAGHLSTGLGFFTSKKGHVFQNLTYF